MDLLKQYQRQYPGAAPPQRRAPAPEYGFFIRLVMRLSGGRVRDVRQASFVLLGVIAMLVAVSLFLLTRPFGVAREIAPLPRGVHPEIAP